MHMGIQVRCFVRMISRVVVMGVTYALFVKFSVVMAVAMLVGGRG
ncbi:hypothetical protein HOE425_330704 [Hoeflea sp. EC-HK425]|nr:hypothetical protein HOE425_330704 [Hoeflea sp. EC-HK425]